MPGVKFDVLFRQLDIGVIFWARIKVRIYRFDIGTLIDDFNLIISFYFIDAWISFYLIWFFLIVSICVNLWLYVCTSWIIRKELKVEPNCWKYMNMNVRSKWQQMTYYEKLNRSVYFESSFHAWFLYLERKPQ